MNNQLDSQLDSKLDHQLILALEQLLGKDRCLSCPEDLHAYSFDLFARGTSRIGGATRNHPGSIRNSKACQPAPGVYHPQGGVAPALREDRFPNEAELSWP